jgi:hypothetical protein
MNVIENASTEELLKFKLACKSVEFTDEQIDRLFLNFEIGSKEEIEELLRILIQYRPKIHEKYENQLKQNAR